MVLAGDKIKINFILSMAVESTVLDGVGRVAAAVVAVTGSPSSGFDLGRRCGCRSGNVDESSLCAERFRVLALVAVVVQGFPIGWLWLLS